MVALGGIRKLLCLAVERVERRAHGFLDVQDSRRSFLDLFDQLRAERIIPPLD